MKATILAFSIPLLVIAGCTRETTPTPPPPAANTAAPAATTGASFKPVPLPDPHIAGYAFPEPEQTIIRWTETNDQKAMNVHAWGIWTALTSETDQVFDNQKLRVFETWADPDDLIAASKGPALEALVRVPHRLKKPHQFQHTAGPNKRALVGGNESTVLAFVKYDPTAAEHIKTNNLFSTTALNNFLKAGPSIPDFKNPSISLKPVFQTLASNQLVQGRYFLLNTWPGSPQLTFNSSKNMWESKPFPQSQWGQCIWIDIQAKGPGPGTGGVDTTCAANGSSRTNANTYSVDDFVHFRLTAAEASLQNAEGKTENPPSTAVASAGDYSVLVAMHVTSREITRWTWQTFWWLPNPDQPTAPSSPAIAADRPPQLTGAPRHYAHCVAYSMEYPPQPNTGGSNKGDSIYCFNPYLEAPFDPSDLPDSIPGMTTAGGKPVTTPNNVGAQTNCMSCHERANYNPNNLQTAPGYSGDRYVDLNDPAFNGTLKVDFLWSIPGNAH